VPGWVKLAVSFLVSAILLWLAATQVDFPSLLDALRHANYLYVVLAIGVYFVDLAIRAARWQVLLTTVGPISWRRLYPVLVVGYMANNLLPGKVGELSRAYLVGQREKVSGTAVLATVAIERVVDGLTVIVLLFVTLLLLPSTLPQIGGLTMIATVAAIAFGLGIVAFVVLLAGRRTWVRLASHLLERLPSHIGDRLALLLDRFISGLDVLRDPRQVSRTVGLSVLVWVVGATTYILIAAAFGIPLSLVGAIATICVVNLATALPQAPGGLGVFDIAAQQMFRLFITLVVAPDPGRVAAVASGITIVLHAVIFVPVVVVGLWCLWRMNLPLLAPRSALGRNVSSN
jgi:uncharacterized protein (TIRG00374 family)